MNNPLNTTFKALFIAAAGLSFSLMAGEQSTKAENRTAK